MWCCVIYFLNLSFSIFGVFKLRVCNCCAWCEINYILRRTFAGEAEKERRPCIKSFLYYDSTRSKRQENKFQIRPCLNSANFAYLYIQLLHPAPHLLALQVVLDHRLRSRRRYKQVQGLQWLPPLLSFQFFHVVPKHQYRLCPRVIPVDPEDLQSADIMLNNI